jgi:hypothetical protein
MINKNFTYENVTKEINTVFENITLDIKNQIFESIGIKVKDSKLELLDVLINKFLYSIPENTKTVLTSSYNFDNDSTIVRGSFSYREKQIPLTFYNNLYKKINALYKKLMNIDEKKPIVFAVDGTFNNTNSINKKDYLETSLNMCYFDVTNNLPIEINIEGEKNKNNELLILKNHILNLNIPKNSIVVLDRAYCSYDFIDFLNDNNFKFIIRFRNNCKNFDKIKDIKSVRILKYFDEIKNDIPYDKFLNYIQKIKKKEKGKYKVTNIQNKKELDIKEIKKFTKAEIQIKYEYTLLTNLDIKLHNDKQIKELYKQRWDIEVFFKLLKYNFKFETLKEHNTKNSNKEINLKNSTNEYRKLYMVNLIVICLSKIIEKTHFYNNNIPKDKIKIENNKEIKYVNKPNKSNIVKGIFNKISNIIKGKFVENDLRKTCNSFVTYSCIKLGEHKERKAKNPFLKWYVKGHSNRSLLYKLLEAFLTGDQTKLNKNHKVMYKTCIFKLHDK